MLNTKTLLSTGSAPEAPGRRLVSCWRRLFPKKKAQPGTFGERLRVLRKERGLTQVQVACQADLSPTTVAELELGVRSPAPHDLRAIASALHVPLERMLEGCIEP